MRLWLTGHMKTSIQNLWTTKMLMGKLTMMKQVNKHIVRTQSQLNRVFKFMGHIWPQENSCQGYQMMKKLLQVLEPLTKNNAWCLMCYISGLEIMYKMFLQKKIFKSTQFMYFYLVVGPQGSLTWLKLYIKLYQKNYFIILKKQINHVMMIGLLCTDVQFEI